MKKKIKQMNAPPVCKVSTKKFCGICNDVYESWVTHKTLFDDNQDTENTIGKIPYFTVRLANITADYALQKICMLHDRAEQGKRWNLSIDYMVRFGDWGNEHTRIREIEQELSELYKLTVPARNRILAHNDLETHVNNTALGGFPKGLGDRYFELLQEFADLVYTKWYGQIFPFNDLSKADADEFLLLLKSVNMHGGRRRAAEHEQRRPIAD